jgi:hypothetical protein
MHPSTMILLTGLPGSGKTTLALSALRSWPEQQPWIVCDFELGQDEALAALATTGPLPEHARLIRPSLYELRAILAKLAAPTTPGPKLRLDGQPLDETQIGEPVRQVMQTIHRGRRYRGLILDSLSWLGEHLLEQAFQMREAQFGPERLERLLSPTYTLVRQQLEQLLYESRQQQLLVIGTAWARPRYDAGRARLTDELVPELPRGLEYSCSTILLLIPGVGADGWPRYPADAIVLKSRDRVLRPGSQIEQFTWESLQGLPHQPARPAQSYAILAQPGIQPERASSAGSSRQPEPSARAAHAEQATPTMQTMQTMQATRTPDRSPAHRPPSSAGPSGSVGRAASHPAF